MDKLTYTIIGTIIGGVIVAVIIAYFSTLAPVLFFESGCLSSFYIPQSQITFSIRNRGDIEGLSSVCVRSDSLIIDGSDNKSYLCYNEAVYKPKSTELLQDFKVKFKYLNDSPPEYLNISIYSNCRQKIWGFVNKECEGIKVVCPYKKDYTFYTLLRS